MKWQTWDREFVSNRYRELCGDGIVPVHIAVEIIREEMHNKYGPNTIANHLVGVRAKMPVPQEYRADVESGVVQKAKDGEHCAQCSMPLYYRMQKDGKHIHSWFCPWCHSDEYVMDWRAKTNRKPVGEQNYKALKNER